MEPCCIQGFKPRSVVTYSHQIIKKYSNQFRTVPESSAQFFSGSNNMLWSTASNAAVRSSKTRTEALQQSLKKVTSAV